jgi:hypothetical protein
MPRTARVAPGGIIHHVLNRSVGRMQMFRKPSDFEAFERVMVETHQRQPIRILSCELDGSCQRAFDREGARRSASQHRERTTLRRGRMGAANSEGSRVGAHRSPGGPATKSEPIRHRFNKVSTRRDHPHRFSSSDNSRPSYRPGPCFRPRSRFQSQSRFPSRSRFPSPGGRALRVAPPAHVVGPRPPSRSA